MIIDLNKFVIEERPHWHALDEILLRLEDDSGYLMDLDQARHFHYLYERASADLAKIMTFSSEPEVRRYLELLVARAYSEIHETRKRPHRFEPLEWFFQTFPRTFRRHVNAFWLSLAVTLAGCGFGGFAIALDPTAKEVLMPFSQLQDDPSERVAREEHTHMDRLQGQKTLFSSYLMTHNTKVSIFTLAMGITWGVGTIISLFYNGAILGAVSLDYILAGKTEFLVGWLLPHGAVEIPSILIAGQAGLLLGRALIGWNNRQPVRMRLRAISRDLVTLIIGVAVLLVWAGFVESFLSQYHEPVVPYTIKIGFGVVEIILLTVFWLAQVGREAVKTSSLLIKTPEGVVFSLLLAGPVTRFLAWMIDLACVSVITTGTSIAVSLLGLISADLAWAMTVIVFFITSIGYGMVMEWFWRGQTIGKRLLHLRVVDEQGLRLQSSQIMIRNLLRFVDSLPAFYLVGGVACLCSRRSQRLGDFAANTIVIRHPTIAKLDLDQLLAGKFNSFRRYPHLAARLRQHVSPDTAGIALQALLRRDELDPVSRVELFGEITSYFRSLAEFPLEATEGISDEQYIRNIVDILYREKSEASNIASSSV